MKASLVYWVDEVGGEANRTQIELKPFGYRMAPVTQWRLLIADEDVSVKKGEPKIIRVKKLVLPENTMVGPLSIMRHALGIVTEVVQCGIPEKVEKEKCIDQVLFTPIDDGEIKKGDLVGVLKVFYIRTGLLSKIMNISPPKIKFEKEITEFNLTWRDNGNIHREKTRSEVFGYARSHIGYWELLIADEEVTFNRGDIVRVNIREIELPPNTVVVPLYTPHNVYGTVLDVIQLGKPSKVEDPKRIQQAVFLAVEDGKVEKGDIVGILNVYYVGLDSSKRIIPEKKEERVRIVYKENGTIKKKEITVEPFGYKRKDVARWEVVVADEDLKVKKGEPVIVKVKPIEIPNNTIVYPLSTLRHAYGALVDIYTEKPWKVEEGHRVEYAIYYPIVDGEIRRGDLLGVLNLYQLEIALLDRIKGWLDNWVMETGKVFDYSDWPF